MTKATPGRRPPETDPVVAAALAGRPVDELVRLRAGRLPGAVAVAGEDERLSYRDLVARAAPGTAAL